MIFISVDIKKLIREELLKENVEHRFESMVQDLIEKYGGGRPFFDALDDTVKNTINRDIMLEVLKGLENEWVITSGGFGDFVNDLYENGEFKCLGVGVYNGGMCTRGKGVTCWYPPGFKMDDKVFVYVDDSYFSGGTVRTINEYLKKFHNSHIKEVSVAYDGSKNKSPMVRSLYRYYDKH